MIPPVGPVARSALWYARAFYFLYYAAMAAVMPFLALYYESVGLGASQIGVLVGLMPLVMLVGAPLWSEVADASGRHRLVLWTALGGSIALAAGLSFATSFVALAPLVALFALCVAPIMPLVDHAVLETLRERGHEYGRQRVWGAYGWGLSAPFVGLLADRYDLSWVFFIYVGVMLVALLVSARVPVPDAGVARRFGLGLGAMMRDRRWLVFLVVAFAGGVSLTIVTSFLFLFMSERGASGALIGLAVTVATVSELPVMRYSGALLERFGARGLLVGSSFASTLRMSLYAALAGAPLAAPALVLPVQLLHGSTFAALWVAGVAYAKRLAPSGAGAAAQGLFTGVLTGLGGALGGGIGGLIFERFGPAWLFGAVAALTFVAAVALLATREEAPA